MDSLENGTHLQVYVSCDSTADFNTARDRIRA